MQYYAAFNSGISGASSSNYCIIAPSLLFQTHNMYVCNMSEIVIKLRQNTVGILCITDG